MVVFILLLQKIADINLFFEENKKFKTATQIQNLIIKTPITISSIVMQNVFS